MVPETSERVAAVKGLVVPVVRYQTLTVETPPESTTPAFTATAEPATWLLAMAVWAMVGAMASPEPTVKVLSVVGAPLGSLPTWATGEGSVASM